LDKIFDTNVKSSFCLAKEALPHMEKRGKASIMFVSSVAGYLPNCGVINYKLDCAIYQHHSVADFRISVLVYRLSLWGLTL
jgi:NAD(P)-dependent dehydrogenase (short-subunit alcohol dehydrogenase family)